MTKSACIEWGVGVGGGWVRACLCVCMHAHVCVTVISEILELCMYVI